MAKNPVSQGKLKDTGQKISGSNVFPGSSLINLLKTFSKTEMREFGKFVHSPFHNNRSNVSELYDIINRFYPLFSHRDFSKENVFTMIYPGSAYKDDIMRRLTSNLFKLAEEYLSYQNFRKEEINTNKNLLEQYTERDISSLYMKQYKKTLSALNRDKLRNAGYYNSIADVERINHTNITRRDTTGKKYSGWKQIDSVWQSTVITLLRLYIIMLQNISQFNHKFDENKAKLLLNLIENPVFTKSKAAEILYLAYKLMTDQRSDDIFYKLKKILWQNYDMINFTERDAVFISMLTYCWDMNVKHGKNYSKEEFMIISFMLDKGQLIEGNKMYSEWFMYAFLTATKAGEVKFAEDFIKKYGNMIPESERYNAVNHAYAELEMIKKNYEKSLEYLALPRYNNLSEKMRANNMYLRLYYELGRSEQFFYSVDSFKHMLERETSLSSSTKRVRVNFVKYVSALYRIRLGETKTDISRLRKKIENTETFYNKWLLEKISELEETQKS